MIENNKTTCLNQSTESQDYKDIYNLKMISSIGYTILSQNKYRSENLIQDWIS